MDKLFVIAIGGTGMRCLESFVHLCAIGMFDNEEINILTLDTDQTNGNKGRVERLIENYKRIKSPSQYQDGGVPTCNTFFSAKLNLYKFHTDYGIPSRANYKTLAGLYSGSPKEQVENKLISDLFLDTNTVQEFRLFEGYRAQTHLGSMLMYHGIIEAAINLNKKADKSEEKEKQLNAFVDKLNDTTYKSRVFVFGSVFGGTGASAIPIIPKALQEFLRIRNEKTKQSFDFSRTMFGSTLLTQYFTFNRPSKGQKEEKGNNIIAESDNFNINSQAALNFYADDISVNEYYKAFYHIGWPAESKKIDEDNLSSKTITGGAEQKNSCHITELLCACAAYDFFNRSSNDLSGAKPRNFFKSINREGKYFNFTFNDFMGNENKKFKNNLGAFFSLAHIVLTRYNAVNGGPGISEFLKNIEKNKKREYETITSSDFEEINNYFKEFAYTYDNGKFVRGWIYQVKNTVVNPGIFLFDENAFTEDPNLLKKLDVGALFIKKEGGHWTAGVWHDRLDIFLDVFKKSSVTLEQKVSQPKEQLLATIFNAITASQKLI